MGNSIPLLLFIAGAGIIQALLLGGIVYFHPKGEKSVTRWLAIYIVFLCLPMFIPVVQLAVAWQYIAFVEPVTLLIGPALYLYVTSFKETVTLKKAFPHFILFICIYAFSIYMFTHHIRNYPLSGSFPEEVLTGPLAVIRSMIRIGQMAFYYLLSRKAINAYQRSIQQLYSETSRINLDWVRWLINGYILLLFVGIFFYALMMKFPDQFTMLILANIAVVSPYIYVVAFKGMTQPTLWQLHPETGKEKIQEDLHEVEEIQISPATDPAKSIKPSPANDKSDDIISQTIKLMEEDKLFQETELNLQQLADQLKHPAYLVSQAINLKLNKTFYDLVNGYRVEEAKRLLTDPSNQNYKILSVGFEAGFNSKTTFNTVFKKYTGFSPSEYREKYFPTAATA